MLYLWLSTPRKPLFCWLYLSMDFNVGSASLGSTIPPHCTPCWPVSQTPQNRPYPKLSDNPQISVVKDLSHHRIKPLFSGLVAVCALSRKLKDTSLLLTLIFVCFQIMILPWRFARTSCFFSLVSDINKKRAADSSTLPAARTFIFFSQNPDWPIQSRSSAFPIQP